MTQNTLNDLLVRAQLIQVRSDASTESVPAVPVDLQTFHDGTDDSRRQEEGESGDSHFNGTTCGLPSNASSATSLCTSHRPTAPQINSQWLTATVGKTVA